MALNSLRERIILADKAILDGVEAIKTVKRTMQTYKDLQQFSERQMPVAAIVGDLPKPQNHVSFRDGQVDECLSELRNNIFVYFSAATDEQDALLSSIADDLWVALYADPLRGGLCYYTEIQINPNHEYWEPYVAFNMIVIHHYKHTTGGI